MPYTTRGLFARHLTRRGFAIRASQLAFGAGAGAGAALHGARAFAQGVQEITFLTYGGLYADSQRRAMVDPFTAATGLRVQMPTGADAIATLVGQAGQSAANVDVVALSDVQMVAAINQGGLLAEMDPANVPNAADLPDIARSAPYAYNIEFDPWGILYRTDKMDTPTSWRAIFEPADAGRVALVRPEAESGSLMNMLAASVVAGGGEDDVLELGIPVLRALRDAGAHFVDFGATLSLIQNDGVDLATMFNNEAYFLADQGLPVSFAFPEEGVFPIGVWLGIPANLPPERKAAAEQFVNWMLSPEPQVAMANLMYSGPTNMNAEVGPDLADKVLTGATMDRAYAFDLERIVALQDQWLEAWNREIAG